jgi:glycosyltransferase involved in cell wall biosynthesis
MRIAMIGLRGVPALSGGIERSVEQLGAALVARGHDVTVYCRSNYVDGQEPTHDGMHLRVLPTIGTKHLDAIVHTSLATGNALSGFDVLHYHALGPGLLAWLPRAVSRSAIVQTVHGIDWQRAKWGRFARAVLRCGERASTRIPHELIVPSAALANHYRETYRTKPTVIPNPFPVLVARPPAAIRDRFGLEPRGYVLFVGRLTPEKQVDLLLRAYRRVQTDHRLVIVGGSSFTDSHVAELKALADADDRVIMTGELHGEVLEELFTNALGFTSPSALEGFNITLVEAISAELPIVASAIEPHVELLGPMNGAAHFHDVGSEASLAGAISDMIGNPGVARGAVARYKAELLDRFSPDRVALLTEAVYERALARRRGALPSSVRVVD